MVCTTIIEYVYLWFSCTYLRINKLKTGHISTLSFWIIYHINSSTFHGIVQFRSPLVFRPSISFILFIFFREPIYNMISQVPPSPKEGGFQQLVSPFHLNSTVSLIPIVPSQIYLPCCNLHGPSNMQLSSWYTLACKNYFTFITCLLRLSCFCPGVKVA